MQRRLLGLDLDPADVPRPHLVRAVRNQFRDHPGRVGGLAPPVTRQPVSGRDPVPGAQRRDVAALVEHPVEHLLHRQVDEAFLAQERHDLVLLDAGQRLRLRTLSVWNRHRHPATARLAMAVPRRLWITGRLEGVPDAQAGGDESGDAAGEDGSDDIGSALSSITCKSADAFPNASAAASAT